MTVTRIGQRARIKTKPAPIRLVANTTTDIADAVSGPNEPNAMKAIARISGKYSSPLPIPAAISLVALLFMAVSPV